MKKISDLHHRNDTDQDAPLKAEDFEKLAEKIRNIEWDQGVNRPAMTATLADLKCDKLKIHKDSDDTSTNTGGQATVKPFKKPPPVDC